MINRALLIGNNSYKCERIQQLLYAENDVTAISDRLQKNYGFESEDIELLTSATQDGKLTFQKINDHLHELTNIDEQIDRLILVFCGHGFLWNGERFFCGWDADPDQLQATALNMNLVMGYVSQINARSTAVVFDCCQTDPHRGPNQNLFSSNEPASYAAKLTRDVGVTRRLGFTPGVSVLYACSPGQSARPWQEKQHGVFSYFLLEALDQKLETTDKWFDYVDNKMRTNANRSLWTDQNPYYQAQGNVVRFLPEQTGRVVGTTEEMETFDPDNWRQSEKRNAGEAQTLDIMGVPFNFRWIPAGDFAYGGPAGQKIELQHGFWMLETPVTQRMWKLAMGDNPSWFSANGEGAEKVQGDTDDFPVENVTWEQIKEFLRFLLRLYRLNTGDETSGLEFRLPTEVEWEYAALAESYTLYPGSNKLDKVGWYKDNSEERTHLVTNKDSNAWGLRGMCGNVAELCKSLNGQTPNTIRGGSWMDDEMQCRTIIRNSVPSSVKANYVGLRLVFAEKFE